LALGHDPSFSEKNAAVSGRKETQVLCHCASARHPAPVERQAVRSYTPGTRITERPQACPATSPWRFGHVHCFGTAASWRRGALGVPIWIPIVLALSLFSSRPASAAHGDAALRPPRDRERRDSARGKRKSAPR